jgi:hypothetical protein
MLKNLFQLLAPPSAYTIYDRRTRARVINYWHQGRRRAHSVPPDHLRRKNEENPSITARGCHVVPVDIYLKANWPFGEMCQVVTKKVRGLTGRPGQASHESYRSKAFAFQRKQGEVKCKSTFWRAFQRAFWRAKVVDLWPRLRS